MNKIKFLKLQRGENALGAEPRESVNSERSLRSFLAGLGFAVGLEAGAFGAVTVIEGSTTVSGTPRFRGVSSTPSCSRLRFLSFFFFLGTAVEEEAMGWADGGLPLEAKMSSISERGMWKDGKISRHATGSEE